MRNRRWTVHPPPPQEGRVGPCPAALPGPGRGRAGETRARGATGRTEKSGPRTPGPGLPARPASAPGGLTAASPVRPTKPSPRKQGLRLPGVRPEPPRLSASPAEEGSPPPPCPPCSPRVSPVSGWKESPAPPATSAGEAARPEAASARPVLKPGSRGRDAPFLPGKVLARESSTYVSAARDSASSRSVSASRGGGKPLNRMRGLRRELFPTFCMVGARLGQYFFSLHKNR